MASLLLDKKDAHIAQEEQAMNEDEKRRWKSTENPAGADNDLASSPAGNASDSDEEIYPEGGLRAWLVVFGSFTAMVASFGLLNTIGTFQAYLSTHQLHSLDQGTIAWIFSLYVFLSFFSGVQIGPIFDAKGPRILVLAGSISLVVSMMLLGSCHSRLIQIACQVDMVTALCRVLALYRRVQYLGRPGYCLDIRARRRGHWPLLSDRPWKSYRRCDHRWVDRRHHFPSDAGEPFSEDWLRLEYAGHGVRVPLSTHNRQHFHSLPTTSQAGWQLLARLSHLQVCAVLPHHGGRVVCRMGPLRSAELHELVCSCTWLFHHLLLSDPCHHQCWLVLRTLAPGLYRRLHRPVQHHDLDGAAMSHRYICVMAASRKLDRADCGVFGPFWDGER